MTDRHDPGTTAQRIAHLEDLRVQSQHIDPKAEERQRARGKGLARERIEALFDAEPPPVMTLEALAAVEVESVL